MAARSKLPESTDTGWYYLRSADPADCRVGPLGWEQLRTLAADGRLWPIDLVWHPLLHDWSPAGHLPGLFPPTSAEPAPDSAPRRTGNGTSGTTPAPDAPEYPPPWSVRPRPRLLDRLRLFLVPVVALLLFAGAGSVGYALWRAHQIPDAGGTDPTASQTQSPGMVNLSFTEAWGDIATGRADVLLARAQGLEAMAVPQVPDGVWLVRIAVPAPFPADTITVTLTATEGAHIGGDPAQDLVTPGQVWWLVTVPGSGAMLTITRSDTGAAAKITIPPMTNVAVKEIETGFAGPGQ
jgi:hypothetical protein